MHGSTLVEELHLWLLGWHYECTIPEIKLKSRKLYYNKSVHPCWTDTFFILLTLSYGFLGGAKKKKTPTQFQDFKKKNQNKIRVNFQKHKIEPPNTTYQDTTTQGYKTHWSGPQFQQKLRKGDQIREDDLLQCFNYSEEVVKFKIIALNTAL
jgi:hypothetical protein